MSRVNGRWVAHWSPWNHGGQTINLLAHLACTVSVRACVCVCVWLSWNGLALAIYHSAADMGRILLHFFFHFCLFVFFLFLFWLLCVFRSPFPLCKSCHWSFTRKLKCDTMCVCIFRDSINGTFHFAYTFFPRMEQFFFVFSFFLFNCMIDRTHALIK